MDRPKNDDTPAKAAAPSPAPKEEPTPAPPAPAPAPSNGDLYEPYPGAHFFHGGRNSPIVQAFAVRLQQEGHWQSAQAPGPDWTNAHKRATASYQHELRPKEGGDVSGIPDQVAWDKLGVPRVSPR
ncbi:peptidoglycan-binding protein [Streptomyces sp. NPDC087866]|uniref:peptidoglycan-binding protein n=1 Tax=Streptomyces sp. NPDC087866 TaxID=3365815 RepID=UPI00380F119D